MALPVYLSEHDLERGSFLAHVPDFPARALPLTVEFYYFEDKSPEVFFSYGRDRNYTGTKWDNLARRPSMTRQTAKNEKRGESDSRDVPERLLDSEPIEIDSLHVAKSGDRGSLGRARKDDGLPAQGRVRAIPTIAWSMAHNIEIPSFECMTVLATIPFVTLHMSIESYKSVGRMYFTTVPLSPLCPWSNE